MKPVRPSAPDSGGVRRQFPQNWGLGGRLLLTASLALALSGMSVLLPHTPARAQAPKFVLAGVTTPAAPVEDGDGDGDELLEHWGDPRYSHEQAVQLCGMAAFFSVCGAVSCRRRAALRRCRRHD